MNYEFCTYFVAGALDPPMLIYVTSLNDSTYFKLSWPPSFTLEHTDINYRVCNNATNTCVNTTDTAVTSIVMCSPVLYQVSACNSVGCSENTTVIHPQGIFTQSIYRIPETFGDRFNFGDLVIEKSTAKCTLVNQGKLCLMADLPDMCACFSSMTEVASSSTGWE